MAHLHSTLASLNGSVLWSMIPVDGDCCNANPKSAIQSQWYQLQIPRAYGSFFMSLRAGILNFKPQS